MSNAAQLLSAKTLTIQPLRPCDLANAVQNRLTWLWHGYLGLGKVTALISPPKSGKTTLLSHLLARFGQGGQLAGLPITAARVLVLSEEAAADWDARCRQLALGPNVQFLCRPFHGARPTDAQWLELIASVEAMHRQEPLDLVVIDALAAFLPGYAETCAPMMLDCLLPLQELANLGPAIWLLHHPAKQKRADGQSSRGTGALTGFADIVMELSCYRRARSRDRRRRICAYSRYTETPRTLIVELNAEGTDYLVHTAADASVIRPWPALQEILEGAHEKLSLNAILERWPDEEKCPTRRTLSRWMTRTTQQGTIRSTGNGTRGNPVVYWLEEREPYLFPGHAATKEQIDAWKERCSSAFCASFREKAAG
jgi:AAA domain